MNYSEEIAVDCPNCKNKKVGHHYCYLIDNYKYNFVSYETYDLTESSLEFENRSIYEIICNHCKYKRLVVLNDECNNVEKTIYPILPEGEPLPDCIDECIRKDFDEARLIVNYSVRCAVGLLRICGEKLCNFIADRYITDKDIKQEIKEKQKELKPKINLLVKYRKDYFPFIDEECIKNLEVVKDAGNRNLHANLILDEYTRDDFKTLCTIIAIICDAIATKEKNDKRINALKEKNDINDPKKR